MIKMWRRAALTEGEIDDNVVGIEVGADVAVGVREEGSRGAL